MRIELKDENQEEEQPRRGDRLEDKYESDLTPKEKRMLERQKLKGMGTSEKLEYIWMYYKPVIFGFVAVIAAVFIIRDLYHNAQIDTILSICVVNGAVSDNDAATAEICELLGSDSPLERVDISTNMRTNENMDGLDYYSQMLFMAQAQTGSIDIAIMPEELYEQISQQEFFEDLHVILGEDGYEAMGDLAEGTCLKVDSSLLGDYIAVPSEEVCIAVLVTTKNKENAAKWLLSLVD